MARALEPADVRISIHEAGRRDGQHQSIEFAAAVENHGATLQEVTLTAAVGEVPVGCDPPFALVPAGTRIWVVVRIPTPEFGDRLAELDDAVTLHRQALAVRASTASGTEAVGTWVESMPADDLAEAALAAAQARSARAELQRRLRVSSGDRSREFPVAPPSRFGTIRPPRPRVASPAAP